MKVHSYVVVYICDLSTIFFLFFVSIHMFRHIRIQSKSKIRLSGREQKCSSRRYKYMRTYEPSEMLHASWFGLPTRIHILIAPNIMLATCQPEHTYCE